MPNAFLNSLASLLPALLIVLPASAAVSIGRWGSRASPRRLLAATIAVMAVVSACATLVILAAGEIELTLLGGASAPLVVLRADALAILFLWLALLVIAAVCFLSSQPGRGEAVPILTDRAFWRSVLSLWAGLNLAFLAGDLVSFYLALEVIALSTAPMLILSGGKEPQETGRLYLGAATIGSMLFFIGAAILATATEALSLPALAEGTSGAPLERLALVLISTALLLRAAVWPLHAWLPPSHSSAQAPVSALLSGLVSKTALYILLRLWFEVFGEFLTPFTWSLPGFLGGVAVLWGSLLALRQESLKLMIAYSTVAQLGYMLLIFPLAGPGEGESGPWAVSAWAGGLLQMLSHGLSKAAAFLAAGAIVAAMGGEMRGAMAGGTRRAPVAFLALAIAGLSLAALPPSGGFLAKWLLLRSALGDQSWWLVFVMLLGGLMTAGYLLRFLLPAFQPTPEGMDSRQVPASPLATAALVLALLSLAMGFGAWPLISLMEETFPGIVAEAEG